MSISTEHANAAFFAAMAKAQGEVENASKSSTNQHFRSKYADLAEVLNTIREPLAKHGLSLIQSTGFDGAMVHVTTILAHADGGYITAVASCVPAKSDAQGVGAATTYLRRYSAASLAGIAQEDDDGNASAHDRKPEPVYNGRPTDGAWEVMSEESQAHLLKIAANVIQRMVDPEDAADYISTQGLDNDEKAALWTRLDSKTRTALTKALNARKGAK